MKLLTRIFCASSISLMVGCGDSSSIYVRSRIDLPLENYIKSLEAKNLTITISSTGGDTQEATRLGVYLLTKNLSVEIVGKCFSACSEFILPAAEKIVFTNEPMIGFHWSPIMDYNLYIKAGADMSICQFVSLADQKKLLATRNLNVNFWQEVEARLKLTKFEFVDKGETCPWKIREFENKFWLPTSLQLRELWGLKFDGAVCADNLETCIPKIDAYWSKGSRIVVGDKVYVSRGYNTK